MTQSFIKFFGNDWRSDPLLRMCSAAARGVWADLITFMMEAEPFGSLLINGRQPTTQQIAALTVTPPKVITAAMKELEENGVFSRDGDGTIFSRRMRREASRSVEARELGLKGGNPEIRRGTVPKDQRVRPYRRSDSPGKTRRIFERAGGKCHWCSVELVYEGESQPNLFHVDHVVAICDGGTNDESNLVAACAACNHRRARDPEPTASADNKLRQQIPTLSPDNNRPQIPTITSRAQPEARSQKPEARSSTPITKDATELVDAFWAIRESFWGGDPNGRMPSHGDGAIAQRWVEAGVPFYPARWFFEDRMRRMHEGSKSPPNGLRYFEKAILEAQEHGWPGYREGM